MDGSAVQQKDRRAVVLRTLLLDAVAARCVALLSEQGVPAILLKGRAIASWLYPDGLRDYGDVDLLVDPARRGQAIDVLGSIGYRHWLAGASDVEFGSNETELIGPPGVCIDLHHTLLGVAAGPARCWEVLSRRTEVMSVGGRAVTVLDPEARTMHLALHVAQNGPIDTKAVTDLERGLAQLPFASWQEAERLARSIDAIEAFSAGLRVTESGHRLALQLRLSPPRDVGLVLRTRSAPPEALQIQKLVEAGSMRSRIRLISRKLWPTSVYMLGRVPGARAGGSALLAARLRRLAGLPGKFGIALWNWAQAKRTARQLYSEHMTSLEGRDHP